MEIPYVVKMSGVEIADSTTHAGLITYYFRQDIPIPSYLTAMAVGNLVYKSVGSRTGVITEPVMLDKCVNELQDLQ